MSLGSQFTPTFLCLCCGHLDCNKGGANGASGASGAGALRQVVNISCYGAAVVLLLFSGYNEVAAQIVCPQVFLHRCNWPRMTRTPTLVLAGARKQYRAHTDE